MIGTNEQVLADAPPHAGRRRSDTVTATRAPKSTASTAKKTLSIQRTFSDPKTHPFDQVEWERRLAEITDDAGKVVFKQDDVEVPKGWSQLATKVVVSKYFYGEQGTLERETSVRQLIHRICRTIADWGIKDGYFTKAGGEVFYDELTWLCLNQYGAFNSPVWFNGISTASKARPSGRLPCVSSSTASAARLRIGVSRTDTSPKPAGKYPS